MLRSLEVCPQRDHTRDVALADEAGEHGLHCGLLVLLAVVVWESVLLFIKEVDRWPVVLRVITDISNLHNPGNLYKPLSGGGPVHHCLYSLMPNADMN